MVANNRRSVKLNRINTAPNGKSKSAKAYFRAGDPVEKTMSGWRPRLQSADVDLNRYRDTITARTRDLIRNNGYAQAIVHTFQDNVIGHFFKLSPMPNYRLLGRNFAWSQEFGLDIKARWNAWANSSYYYPDFNAQNSFVEILKQAMFSYITVGECFAVIRYKKDAGRYRLKVQLIEPERVSTPTGFRNDKSVIAGVRSDKNGRPTGYYICDQHPSDTGSKTWTFVSRKSTAGRKQVIHLFDQERPGQKRGRGIFAPIIQQFKLLDNYKITESERAIAQAMFAAVISSDMPSADAFSALGAELDGDDDCNPLETYMGYQADFKDSSGGLAINGSKVAHLATNESLDIIKSDSPNTAYAQFTDANIRELAAGTGASYEQVSKDFSKTTYASARTAMIEAWKRFLCVRQSCPSKLAAEIYALWLEEDLQLVSGYPDATVPRFSEMPEAWTGAAWIAPGKGEIDPLKQSNASRNNLEILRTTHEEEAAEIGKDFDEILQRQAYEQTQIKEMGLSSNSTQKNEDGEDEEDD